MAGYIKSHSNYRIQTRHQLVNDGAIFERDISTIGGANTFATGQATVYQSGNFVMVVNNSSSASRHVRKEGWLAAGNGTDQWSEEELQNHSSDIVGSVEESIMLKNDFMDLRSFAYYGSLEKLIENTVTGILTDFPFELYIDKSEKRSKTDTEFDFASIIAIGVIDFYEVSNPGSIDIYRASGNTRTDNTLGYFHDGGVNNYELYYKNGSTVSEPLSITWKSTKPNIIVPVPVDKKPCPGDRIADIQITYGNNNSFTIYAFLDSEMSIRYFVADVTFNKFDTCWIRPKEYFYEDFIDSLDLFGKTLIGYYSGVKNTSKFEVLDEDEFGVTRTVTSFEFPLGDNGKYNLAVDGSLLETYVKSLAKIGNRYDEYYTDNLYRMMTHDSLKNLDWTNGFNGAEGYDNHYVKSGEKFDSIIRVMGYVFDNEKAYIDSIGNSNTVTYSNRSNMSDYFLTDSLETDGWNVNNIYPYDLREYSASTKGLVDVTDVANIWSKVQQEQNRYQRKFNENTSEIIKPYEGSANPTYVKCDGESPKEISVDSYSGQSYVVSEGDVYNVTTNYSNDSEITVPDVNNEFMKRFRINSRHILRKKGTIEGVESMLSLFGMKSKRVDEEDYDFDIEEYVAYAPYITDTYDSSLGEYKINWYNKVKTISYPTIEYSEGVYVDYQGLPVKYKDVNNQRRLYPYFNSYNYYDDGMYYQMNGGWLNYDLFRFTEKNEMLRYDSNGLTTVETIRNVMFANDINELLSQPMSDLSDGIIYYVNDISDKYAVIDGTIYPLKSRVINGNPVYYFDVYVYDSSVAIGDELYTGMLTVSDPNGLSGKTTYNLSLYADSTIIRIYYTGERNKYTEESGLTKSFYISATGDSFSGSAQPTMALMYDEGYLSGVTYSHYFKLKDINNSLKLGPDGWEQITIDESIYKIVDSVVDNYEGNNPHSGNFAYDNGQEYINRYGKLFKYASENRLFNESCFTDVDAAYEEIDGYGFPDVMSGNRNMPNTKVHSYLDTYNKFRSVDVYNPTSNDKWDILLGECVPTESQVIYSTDTMTLSNLSGSFHYKEFMEKSGESIKLMSHYNDVYIAIYENDNWKKIDKDIYTATNYENVRICSLVTDPPRTVSYKRLPKHGDSEPSQVINTKNLKLTFKIKSNYIYEKTSQEEIKYIQSKVMPYVEQIIPSTAIVHVKYEVS